MFFYQKKSIMKNHYNKWIYISEAIGNNSFSYKERIGSWSECKIYIPAIASFDIYNSDILTLSDKVCFEEIDENWKLHKCYWLSNHIFVNWKPNIYIIDNHNHALYRWYDELLKWNIKKWSTLIHIDQHADMWIPQNPISQNIYNLQENEQLDYIYKYTNTECNVGNFIVPAKDIWLVWEIYQIRTRYKLEQTVNDINHICKENTIILDIDCDFWSDEIDQESIKSVRKMMKYADLITVATSPYFIDFDKAKKVVNLLFVEN